LVSLVVWPMGLYTGKYVYWIAFFLFSEVSPLLSTEGWVEEVKETEAER
jgi:hypothetical protein